MGEHIDQEAQPATPVKREPGQRTFLVEVGIIVLGVLIALVIGEIATALKQRVEARRSLAAIRSDMVDNSSAFELRSKFTHVQSGGSKRFRKKWRKLVRPAAWATSVN